MVRPSWGGLLLVFGTVGWAVQALLREARLGDRVGEMPGLAHHAVLAPVGEVDDEADQQPDQEPQPVVRRQREHEHQAGEDAQDRDDRDPRAAEGPVGVGVLLAHDEHGRADDHEGEERADVGQVEQRVERQEAREQDHEEADQDRRLPRGPELRVHVGEERLGDQTVARHGQEHPRAGEHHDEEHRRDAGDTGRGDEPLGPAEPLLLEGVGDRSVYVELVVLHHAGEHRDDEDVQDRADDQRA